MHMMSFPVFVLYITSFFSHPDEGLRLLQCVGAYFRKACHALALLMFLQQDCIGWHIFSCGVYHPCTKQQTTPCFRFFSTIANQKCSFFQHFQYVPGIHWLARSGYSAHQVRIWLPGVCVMSFLFWAGLLGGNVAFRSWWVGKAEFKLGNVNGQFVPKSTLFPCCLQGYLSIYIVVVWIIQFWTSP